MALRNVETLPTNLLEAVNLALDYMREPPIDDLALVNTSYPVEKAYRAVLQSTRAIQRRDYAFNQFKIKLTAALDEASGEYRIPAPEASVKIVLDPEAFTYDRDAYRPMIVGFPNANGKYEQFIVDGKIGATSRDWKRAVSLDCLVTIILPFDALPEPAKAVVALEAAARCGETAGEGIESAPFHTMELQEAQADLMNYDLTVAPANFYTTLDNRR